MSSPSPLQNGHHPGPDDPGPLASDVTTVRSQISEEELTRFFRWRMSGTSAGRARLLKGLLLAVLLGAGGGYLMDRLLEPTSVSLFLILGLGLPLGIGIGMWRQASALAQAYKKQAPQMYDPVSWTLREDGLLLQTADQTSVREWRSIRELHVTHEFLVFEMGEMLALALPRRCFPTPAASQKFATLAQELWAAARHRVTDPPTAADLEVALGSDRVEVSFETTPRDLLWLFRHATFTFFRRQPGRVLRLTLAMLVVSIGLGMLTRRDGIASMAVAAATPLVVMPIFILGVRPFLQARQYGKLPGMVGPHSLWASERGTIGYTADTGINRTEWSAYSRLHRVSGYLVFERGEGIHSGLPLRGQDPAVIDQLIGWHEAAQQKQPAMEALG